jgi:hypothetical protein
MDGNEEDLKAASPAPPERFRPSTVIGEHRGELYQPDPLVSVDLRRTGGGRSVVCTAVTGSRSGSSKGSVGPAAGSSRTVTWRAG